MSAHGTDEGGCKWAIVNRTTFERHISGEEMIGIYPMVYNPKDTTAEFNCETLWFIPKDLLPGTYTLTADDNRNKTETQFLIE